MVANVQEILTERQVSDWLGISEPTLFRHRRDGTGPTFIRLSERRVAYRRGAVEAWLSERERQQVETVRSRPCRSSSERDGLNGGCHEA
jgi:predicted DNA-binding transcriptional regulator AlpA